MAVPRMPLPVKMNSAMPVLLAAVISACRYRILSSLVMTTVYPTKFTRPTVVDTAVLLAPHALLGRLGCLRSKHLTK